MAAFELAVAAADEAAQAALAALLARDDAHVAALGRTSVQANYREASLSSEEKLVESVASECSGDAIPAATKL